VRSRLWQVKESDVRTADGICTTEDKDEATQCCFVLVMRCCFLLGVCLRSGQLAGGNCRLASLSQSEPCKMLSVAC
jgi:hypothetical protein